MPDHKKQFEQALRAFCWSMVALFGAIFLLYVLLELLT